MSAQQVTPRHIAIVMDGNGRWASKRFLPRIAGHKQGVEALKSIVKACARRQIPVLTVFAFSSENWNRPAEEVSGLLDILVLALSREVGQLKLDGVQLHFVGAREQLSDRVKKGLDDAEAQTADNSRLILNVCFNYGGRWDIAQAARRLAESNTTPTEQNLAKAMSLSHCEDPDLLIRTGGETRLSNFLLWQAAYSELYFTDSLWPDFDEIALDRAIEVFGTRERRFGKTSEQVSDAVA